MGTGRILPTMIALGLPAATAGIAQTLFEVVDTWFITQLGTAQISGVGLVMPLFFCSYAVANAVTIGVSALLSRRLGEGRPDRAQDVLNLGLLMSAVVGTLLTVVMVVWMDAILQVVGRGDASILKHSRDYASIMFFGMFFLHVGAAADGALRAQGNTVTPMKVGIVTNILNAVLDWLFIFKLGMGVPGAAIATLASRSCMAVVLVGCLWSRASEVKPGELRRLGWRERLQVIGEIYWLGLPASVGIGAMAASIVVINHLLMDIDKFAVGVLAIAWRVESFAFMPIFGLFSAVLPMVGYNLGRGSFARCRRTIWAAAGLAAAVMGGLGAIVFAFPAAFFGVFSKDPALLPSGVQYLRIMMPVYPFMGINIMISAGFQGLGKAWISMLLNLWRNLIIKLPVAYWFGAMWGLTGVWISFPASSLLSTGIYSVWMVRVLRRLESGADSERTPAASDQ